MIEIVIPEIKDKDNNVKDIVFSILADGNPKKLTQLHNEMKKLYGVSVSFQAVLKAVNHLIKKKVLVRNEMTYIINTEWIFESRNFMDRLYRTYFNVQEPIKKVELGKEVTVYTVNNLLELDRLWNDLLINWAKQETKDKRNVWKGKHCWWLIPRLQEEDILHDLFIKQGIKTYNLLSEDKMLDKVALSYYKKKGEYIKTSKKSYSEKDTHVSAFGDFLVKFEIPKDISSELEKVYIKTKNIQNIDLKKVLDIFKKNTEIEVTIIKDKFIADNIKDEVISYFKIRNN